MHESILECFGIRVTGWKLVGYVGVFMFTARWFVQMLASRRAGKPTVPRLFWFLSMLGSLLCLTYFVFGKNDSVAFSDISFPPVYPATISFSNNGTASGRAVEGAGPGKKLNLGNPPHLPL